MAASAVTLWQAGQGIMDVPAASILYNRTFDEVRMMSDKVPRQGKPFFAERKTNRESFKEGEVSSVLELPMKNADTDRIPLLTPVVGHTKSVTIYQYRSAVIVTKTAVESQDHRYITKMLTGLPNSSLRKEEYMYASLFNSGFDESILAGDGMAIFDSARPKEDQAAGSWSNLAASPGTITSGSYFTAWQNFQNRTDERGFPAPMNLSEIVYPPALHEDVMHVLKSPKTPENALNATNPFQGDAKPTKYNWLTSSDAWYARGDLPSLYEGFLIVWRVKPEYASISDTMNPELIMGKRLRMASEVMCIHSKNWYGNLGA